MPRPKGSKNKPKETQEFDYENETGNLPPPPMEMRQVDESTLQAFDYDSEVSERGFVTSAAPPAMGSMQNPNVYVPPPLNVPSYFPQNETVMQTAMQGGSRKLFLVEGSVRLDRMNSGSIISEQSRIVWASNLEEALQKYVNYFQGMSSQAENYVVVRAGGSEAL